MEKGCAHPDLPLIWEKAGGGVRLEGLCPSQALVERGFVEPQPPPPAAGTFLGRGLASSPALGRRAEARGQGGGLSMGLCASSQEASVAKLAALTLQPTGPRPPSTQEPSPAWSP